MTTFWLVLVNSLAIKFSCTWQPWLVGIAIPGSVLNSVIEEFLILVPDGIREFYIMLIYAGKNRYFFITLALLNCTFLTHETALIETNAKQLKWH